MLRARKRELLEEQRSRWAEGRPTPPEEFLGRWPTDPDSDPDAASLLLEDYLQSAGGARRPAWSDYAATISRSRRQALEGLLAQETVFRSMGRESEGAGFPLRLPDVGDEVFGFRLRRPSARGRSPGCSWRSRPTWPAGRSS